MILIDDFYHSSSHLSEIGRQIFYPEVTFLYEEILRFSTKSNWEKIKYFDFTEWVLQGNNESSLWLIADNLFPVSGLSGQIIKLNSHRHLNFQDSSKVAGSNLTTIISRTQILPETTFPIVILDDAIYTGNTMRSIITEHQLSSRCLKIITCCTKPKANRQRSFYGDCTVKFMHLAKEKEDILHLHDFIPFFPFSGRRILLKGENVIPLRLCASLYEKGKWLHINRDLYKTVNNFLNTLILKMTKYLNRHPVVDDVKILGSGIEMQLRHVLHNVSLNSKISDLF